MRITRFGGIVPALDAKQLNTMFGTTAMNVRVWDGTLRAMRTASPAAACAPDCEVEIGVGEVEDQIKVANGQLVHADGTVVVQPRPTDIPSVRVVTAGKDAIAFRYSTVNKYGEESAKSNVSSTVRVEQGSRIIVNAGSYPMRLYAYVTDSLTGQQTQEDFLLPFGNEVLVGEFTGPANFVYDLSTWAMSNDGYNTDDWCVPNGIKCITKDLEGYYYAYSDNTVWISERHLAHAWPRRQVVYVKHTIRDLVPYYDVVFITTNQTPALLRKPMITQGIDEGLVDANITYYSQSHPATGPAASTDFGVIYPSTMGLVALTPTVPNGLQLFTRNLINEDTWREKWSPTVLTWCQGVAYGSNADRGFLLDVKDNNEGSYELGQMVEIAPFKTACCHSGYPVLDGRAWNSGTGYLAATWVSRIFVEVGVVKLTAAKVVGRNLAGIVFELHERKLGLLRRVTLTDADSNVPFNLPMKRGQDYWVSLVLPATGREIAVEEVHVAATRWELLKSD